MSDEFSLPMIVLHNVVLFPKTELPLLVSQNFSLNAINESLRDHKKTVLVFTQKVMERGTRPLKDCLHAVGTRATILRITRMEQGVELLLLGEERVKLLGVFPEGPVIKARYEKFPLPEEKEEGEKVEAVYRSLVDVISRMGEYLPLPTSNTLLETVMQVEGPMAQVYFMAMLMNMDVELQQRILEAPTRFSAMETMKNFLEHEIRVLEIKRKINSNADLQIMKQQKENVLRHQLAAIQKELGEKDPGQADVEALFKKFEETDFPENIRQELERELGQLKNLNPGAPDYQIIRSHLTLIMELPWGKGTKDNLDLSRARRILDEDHFGLKDIKERIIEYLAVLKLNPGAKGPILCFLGPPGVGKTSLGASIARALERKFERISLGGMHDEGELRGHRRTYIGAMPGRIIKGIRRAGVMNPLVMLDEADKMAADFRGDPASALMEILDPTQNHSFHDNYLDLPYDLSQVFFILTANSLENIPRPLLDRMEVLNLGGYSSEEKLQIAKRYLIPQKTQEAGLTGEQFQVTEEAVLSIIHDYTREAGVRDLERNVARLGRKVAIGVAEGDKSPVTIALDGLGRFLGPPRFSKETVRKILHPGVAIGLAWTPFGGDVLYIEATLLPQGEGTFLTGKLGDVMKESAQAARSYIFSHAADLGIKDKKIHKWGVHIHVPEGGTSKDGPSAGVTMATALASLYTGYPVRSDTALTGEITLTGLILPVGGLKEKTLAAQRSGIRRMIIPKNNHKDLAEIPEHVRTEMEFIEVENLQEVFPLVIPQLKRP